MRSEDDIPCNRRLKALVAVFVLFLIGAGQADGLEVLVQGRGTITGVSREQIIGLLQEAGRRIEYLTGLDCGVQVTVMVYQDPAAYLREGLPSWSMAAYRDGIIHLRNPLRYANYRQLQSITSHELFHALVDYHGYTLPDWFEEGLAQVLSYGINLPNADTRYVNSDTIERYRAWHRVMSELVDRYDWQGIRRFFELLNNHPFTAAYQEAFPWETSIPDIPMPPW